MVNTNLDKIGKKLNQLKGKYNVNNNISNIKIMAKKKSYKKDNGKKKSYKKETIFQEYRYIRKGFQPQKV